MNARVCADDCAGIACLRKVFWVAQTNGKHMAIVCIKIGGSTIDAPGLLDELGQSVKQLVDAGHAPVIVHGGGKDIARQLKALDREFTFVDGMRVTDAETMQTVQMVLSGDVNKRIVNALLCENAPAIGISGVDGNLFTAEKMLAGGRDIGHVGSIRAVHAAAIDMCAAHGFVPVVSPVSRDLNGDIFNVNADLAAGELAIALKADHLLFISDVPGVLIDGVAAREIRIDEVEELITAGHVTGGMIPKVRSAADAVTRGVGRVHIAQWRDNATLLSELDTSTSHGTAIY
jgi:acetylglutamate kinase